MGGIPPQQFTCQLKTMISLLWGKMKLAVCLGEREEGVSGDEEAFTIASFCVCFEKLLEPGISHSSMFPMQFTLKLIDSHLIAVLS